MVKIMKGALLAGVVINIGETLFHAVLFKTQAEEAVRTLGKDPAAASMAPPRTPNAGFESSASSILATGALSVSDAPAMSRSPSRSHWIAAPAMNTLPSRA